MTENAMNNRDMQDTDSEIFQAFPMPRGWNFGGDAWAGNAHEKDTTDFMPAEIMPEINITIIRVPTAR